MELTHVNLGMRIQEENQLAVARAFIKPGVAALIPRMFVLDNKIPEWKNTRVIHYTIPAMGAGFMECQLYVGKDGGNVGRVDNGYENFMYVIEGSVSVHVSGVRHNLEKEGYFWLPPHVDFDLCNKAEQTARVLWVRKKYIPTKFYRVPDPIVSSVLDVVGVQSESDYEQQCMPSNTDFGFDMAMNMLTFYPGVTFPCVETHICEHGNYFVSGRGQIWINGNHYDVYDDDFCFVAPYTPHSATCYGPEPMRYLLYKNINREFELTE